MTTDEKFEKLKAYIESHDPKNFNEETFYMVFKQYLKRLDESSCKKTRTIRRAKYLKQWDYVSKLKENGETAK